MADNARVETEGQGPLEPCFEGDWGRGGLRPLAQCGVMVTAGGTCLAEVTHGFFPADPAEKGREARLVLLSSSTAPAPSPTEAEGTAAGCCRPSQCFLCPLSREWAWFPYQRESLKTRVKLPGGVRLRPASQSLLEHSSCVLKELRSPRD